MATASRDLVPLEPPGFRDDGDSRGPAHGPQAGRRPGRVLRLAGRPAPPDRADRPRGSIRTISSRPSRGRAAPRLDRGPALAPHESSQYRGPEDGEAAVGYRTDPHFKMDGEDFPVALPAARRSGPSRSRSETVKVFDGEYKNLKEAYISPWPVFERVKIDRFTGGPGSRSGSTPFSRIRRTIAASSSSKPRRAWARRRSWLTSSRAAATSTTSASWHGARMGLPSACGTWRPQLIRIWELNPYLIDGMLPGSAGRSDFLQNLLKEAADRRDQIQPGEPIVLVVDALDEAGTPSGQNVLGLPRVLPRGVFLVVSQRPVDVTLSVEGPRLVEPLRADDTKNLGDMRTYLESAVTWPVSGRPWKVSKGGSRIPVHRDAAGKERGRLDLPPLRCGGDQRGQRLPLKLDELPRDLWQYYADYWKRGETLTARPGMHWTCRSDHPGRGPGQPPPRCPARPRRHRSRPRELPPGPPRAR